MPVIPLSLLFALAPEGWPFGELRPFAYRCILADPPWRFQNFSAKGEKKGAAAQYACMTEAQLAALPVSTLAHPEGCALTTWATAPLLPLALRTIEGWGFSFKSAGAWAKRSSTDAAWAFGTGYIYRSAAEFWIVATRGKPSPRSRRIRNLIVAPIRAHSQKPETMRSALVELWDGPRAELFARDRCAGWDSFGDELPPAFPATIPEPKGPP